MFNDVLLLPKHIKFHLKMYRRIISHETKEWNFEENLTFCLKNDMRNLVGLNPKKRKPEKLLANGLLLVESM